MVKFLSVAGIALIMVISITMLWPRFTAAPRPLPLARIHEFIMKTTPGQNAANVLGVADDATAVKISPREIINQAVSSVKSRVSDVIITHAVRAITNRFKDLPLQTQEKVLEELSKGISSSQQGELPPEDLSQPTEQSSEGND